MARTTIDIDSSVLREVKRLAREEGKSISRVTSELLARALRAEPRGRAKAFRWESKAMGARVDLEDKEALYRAIDSA